MSDQLRLMEEAARRGLLPPDKAALLDEARRRGLVGGAAEATSGPPPQMPTASSALGSFARGAVRGARDVVDAGAQLVTRGLEAVAPYTRGDPAGRAAAVAQARGWREGVEQTNAAAERDYRENWVDPQHETAGSVGRIAGNIGAAYPIAAAVPGAAAPALLPRIASGAASGAAVGTLQPTETPEGGNFWAEKAGQAGAGAAGGAIGTVAMAPLVRALSRPKAGVQTLMDEGVRPTPGQIMGGAVQRVEDKLQSVPILGDAISASRRAAVREFDRAAINKALAPIGAKLDDATPVGRGAVEEMQQKISAAYNRIIPRIDVPGPDAQFAQDVTAIAQQTVVPGARDKFNRIVQESVMPRLTSGPLKGPEFKKIEEKIGDLAASTRISQDVDTRELGSLLTHLQGAFRGLLERSNPQHAAELRAANQAFALSVRVNDAAARVTAEHGVFTPAHLLSSVLRQDRSARHNAFARGDALMQDLAEPGKMLLGDKYPDSGTASRALLALMLSGAAGGVAGGAGAGPVVTGALAGPAAAATLAATPYLPGARNLAAHLLATRNPTTDAIRHGVAATAGPLGAYLATR